jgi:hypothetical protein
MYLGEATKGTKCKESCIEISAHMKEIDALCIKRSISAGVSTLYDKL